MSSLLIYTYKHKYMFIRTLPFLENAPAVVTLGVKVTFQNFTPQMRPTGYVWEQLPLKNVTGFCLYR